MNNKKSRIMGAFKRFKEITNMKKMTYEEYKAIQAEVVKNMEMLEADHKEQIRLALKEKDDYLNKLRQLYFQQKTDFNNAVQDVEMNYRSSIKALDAVFKSRCVEQRNIRDMATTIFASQYRYPQMPELPTFTQDSGDIEPDVELDPQEGGDYAGE